MKISPALFFFGGGIFFFGDYRMNNKVTKGHTTEQFSCWSLAHGTATRAEEFRINTRCWLQHILQDLFYNVRNVESLADPSSVFSFWFSQRWQIPSVSFGSMSPIAPGSIPQIPLH